MPGHMINSNPYEYSADSINYSELTAARKALDKIRSKNAALADELGKQQVSSAYLRRVLEHMSPPAPKALFSLPPKETGAAEHIRTLEEIIVFNFNKRQTREVTAAFAVYDGGAPKRVDIGMTTLRVLESVFKTPGRTIPETEAMIYLQGLFLRSLTDIRYKSGILAFLRGLPEDNAIVSRIAAKLIELCEAA